MALTRVVLVVAFVGLFNIANAFSNTRTTAQNLRQSLQLRSLTTRNLKLEAITNGASDGSRSKASNAAIQTIASATVPISVVNLVKNCVGSGVFSLNSRVSNISPQMSILGPVTGIVALIAAWATYNFNMIAKTCEMTDTTTYGDAWKKTVSENTLWIIQSIVLIAPIVTCLANTIVLTDIFSLLMKSFSVPLAIYGNRNLVIGILGALVLYPLCTLQDLSAFKAVSAVGIMGHLTAMFTFVVRLVDKSYAVGGAYGVTAAAAALAAKKATKVVTTPSTAATAASAWFVLASILSYCFQAHYNAPRYFAELKGKEKDPNKFFKMVSISYFISTIIYIGTIALAMALFGSKSHSFALNSFAASDPLALVARLAFGTSVLASYPLVFLAMRDWFVRQAQRLLAENKAISNRYSIAALLLGGICLMTSKVSDIGVVASLSGGILGTR